MTLNAEPQEPRPAVVSDAVLEFKRRRDRIRNEMGGLAKVAKQRAAGRLTVRGRIDLLCDPDSFFEVGTFTQSDRDADRMTTPGDGKIGGFAHINGQPVVVAGDDVTVKGGSSWVAGRRRVDRLFEQALRYGNPFIFLGDTGGARLPDSLGSEGLTKMEPPPFVERERQIPMVTCIMGDSFGGAAFMAAYSDLVVQVRGTCLAVTGPKVVEMATGESVNKDDLGGAEVHSRQTGMVDLVAEDESGACQLVRQFLEYLPPSCRVPPKRTAGGGRLAPDPDLLRLVPEKRKQAYDMRKVVRRIVDDGTLMELSPFFGRSLVVGLARLDGHAVGIIANQPTHLAGTITPEACDKGTRLLCLCDAFGLPVIFLTDTPGFMVGKEVEHSRLLFKAIQFEQAVRMASIPKLDVVIRKAFGLAYFSMAGRPHVADQVYSWPGAEISVMDPQAAANVVYSSELSNLEVDLRRQRLAERASEISALTQPYGAAGQMRIDEIIDPADTRLILARNLDRFASKPFDLNRNRVLSSWPTCW